MRAKRTDLGGAWLGGLVIAASAAWAGCSAFAAVESSGTTGAGGGGTGGASASGASTSTSTSASSSTSSGDVTAGAGAGGSATTSTTAASSSSSSGGAGGGGGDDTGASSSSSSSAASSSSSGMPPLKAEVYSHSAATLYRLDPISAQVTVVGNLQGCDSVIDIAIDKSGKIYGTTFSGLYAIDKNTAGCTLIASGSYPNSLSFVPAGTLDPVVETLVGYLGATYVRIDLASGQVSNVGSLGNGYVSSGDIVSVIGGGTYLTVNGNGCDDCLVEVDPKTGAMTKMVGPLGYSAVYGLGYWGGVAYGFDEAGDLFQIDVTTAQTKLVPIPNPPPNMWFWGAGSTTAAPTHM